jgi:hypothetical protein
MLVIEEGVKSGEQVVIKGQLGVTPGGKVRIVQPAASNNPTVPVKPGNKS